MVGPDSMEYTDSRLPERQYLPRRREPGPDEYDLRERYEPTGDYDRADDYNREYDKTGETSYATDREEREGPLSERRFERGSGCGYDREGGEERRGAGGLRYGSARQYDLPTERPGQGYLPRGTGDRHEWDLPGPYKGRGPRGYRRDDHRIWEDVSERLMEDRRIDASDIEVDVRNGEVILRGAVDSPSTIGLAEEVAGRASGVTRVRSELTLRRSRRDMGTDFGREAGPRHQTRSTQEGRPVRESQPREGSRAVPEDYRSRIRVGMAVVDVNGRNLGRVKSMEGNEFLLDRLMARDLYVPCDAIRTVGDVVLLNVPEYKVGDMNWRKREFWSSRS